MQTAISANNIDEKIRRTFSLLVADSSSFNPFAQTYTHTLNICTHTDKSIEPGRGVSRLLGGNYYREYGASGNYVNAIVGNIINSFDCVDITDMTGT